MFSFVQDGSKEKLTSWTFKEKAVILDKLKLLKQCSRATRHHRIWLFSQYSWHFEDELMIQPLISATLVRSGGG